MKCIICNNELSGKQKKFCSLKCKMKEFNSKPDRKAKEKLRTYRNNKYVKQPGDKYNRTGSNNPNWKGGISKDNMLYRTKFVKNNPDIIKAESIFTHAKQAGKIIKKPCEICGDTNSEAHHEDYSKPLEVRWLCRKHHVIENRKRRHSYR